MAEETTKKTTARKPKATKPVEEPVVDMNAMAQQMQQMMAIMAQQQQMIAQLSQQAQQTQKEESVESESKPKNTRGRTRQALRCKYKDTDIYLTSVFKGILAFDGKTESTVWSQYGDVQPISIGDLLLMDAKPVYLHTPWLMLDEYENDEETLDDIISCLGLEQHYRKLYIIQELEENINNVDLEELSKIVEDAEGSSLVYDITAIIQSKINSGEIDNYRLVSEFERIVGRTFNK